MGQRSVRSWFVKVRNGLGLSDGISDQNLLSRAPPCFGRHVKLLVLAAFAVVSIHSSLTSDRRPVIKIFAESLSQHDEIHVVLTTLSEISVEKRKFFECRGKTSYFFIYFQ
jgi:hypothetical protein